MNPHCKQSYLIILSWGRMLVVVVTTPLVRMSWFRCSCLEKVVHIQLPQDFLVGGGRSLWGTATVS